MKIEIIKQANDENVYYKIDEEIKKLNFNNIKDLAKTFLDKKKNGEEINFEVVPQSNELMLYKTTLENIINSVCNDSDLLELYKENNNTDTDDNSDSNDSDNIQEEIDVDNEDSLSSNEEIPVVTDEL